MDTNDNTFMNAVVGAVVTVVFAFLPLAPSIGGGVAGFLQGGALRDGAKVGGVVGLFSMVPFYLSMILVVPLFVIAPFGVPNLPFNATAYAFGMFLLVSFYTIGFGIIGGMIGTYLSDSSAVSDN